MRASVVHDGNIKQHAEVAEELVDVLDGGLSRNRLLHGLCKALRYVAPEKRPALGALVHQLEAMLRGVLHHVIVVTAVNDVHIVKFVTQCPN